MTTTKLKPKWAGEDWQSRLVNVLIKTKPIYALMKHQARQTLIKTAEKKGIPWREQAQALDTPEVRALADQLTNVEVSYPDYYRAPFHAYAEGNLCWPAAFEATPATYIHGRTAVAQGIPNPRRVPGQNAWRLSYSSGPTPLR